MLQMKSNLFIILFNFLIIASTAEPSHSTDAKRRLFMDETSQSEESEITNDPLIPSKQTKTELFIFEDLGKPHYSSLTEFTQEMDKLSASLRDIQIECEAIIKNDKAAHDKLFPFKAPICEDYQDYEDGTSTLMTFKVPPKRQKTVGDFLLQIVRQDVPMLSLTEYENMTSLLSDRLNLDEEEKGWAQAWMETYSHISLQKSQLDTHDSIEKTPGLSDRLRATLFCLNTILFNHSIIISPGISSCEENFYINNYIYRNWFNYLSHLQKQNQLGPFTYGINERSQKYEELALKVYNLMNVHRKLRLDAWFLWQLNKCHQSEVVQETWLRSERDIEKQFEVTTPYLRRIALSYTHRSAIHIKDLLNFYKEGIGCKQSIPKSGHLLMENAYDLFAALSCGRKNGQHYTLETLSNKESIILRINQLLEPIPAEHIPALSRYIKKGDATSGMNLAINIETLTRDAYDLLLAFRDENYGNEPLRLKTQELLNQAEDIICIFQFLKDTYQANPDALSPELLLRATSCTNHIGLVMRNFLGENARPYNPSTLKKIKLQSGINKQERLEIIWEQHYYDPDEDNSSE